MPIDPVLLCKDCIHSRISTWAKYSSYVFELKAPKSHWYKCAKTLAPAHEIVDPVTGHEKIKAKMTYCEIERKHGDCGPTAKSWTPKHKKDLFKALTKDYND
jgi:hypothetical protein